MHKNKTFYQQSTIEIKGKIIGSDHPLVMGIININPDSFFEHSRKQTENEVIEQVEKMLHEKVDIIDLGSYSSRPQAEHISAEEEWDRMKNILPLLRKNYPELILSVDTFRAEIAKKALDEGVDIINDISGGELDSEMHKVISSYQCIYILMHMRGNPQTMQTLSKYDNLLADITQYFKEKIDSLRELGTTKIILDPGFGFAKTIPQNFELLAKLHHFAELGLPILAGLSRKSMIYKSLDITANEALNGTTALNMLALEKGVSILRVHDVKEAVECVKLWELYKPFNN